MRTEEKEFIIEVLDDVTVVLAQHALDETTPDIWDKLAKALSILERSCYREDRHDAEELDDDSET